MLTDTTGLKLALAALLMLVLPSTVVAQATCDPKGNTIASGSGRSGSCTFGEMGR